MRGRCARSCCQSGTAGPAKALAAGQVQVVYSLLRYSLPLRHRAQSTTQPFREQCSSAACLQHDVEGLGSRATSRSGHIAGLLQAGLKALQQGWQAAVILPRPASLF